MPAGLDRNTEQTALLWYLIKATARPIFAGYTGYMFARYNLESI